MREGRASFRDLLGRIDAHLRANGQETRLPELEVFWRAAYTPADAIAAEAFEALLGLAQGQGFDVELLPFVEASRVWSRKVVATRPSTGSPVRPRSSVPPKPGPGGANRRPRITEAGRDVTVPPAPGSRGPSRQR
jgi:hypothetical protein